MSQMAIPAWLTAAFATLMITVAVYSATRLLTARRLQKPTHLDTDAAHIVMGAAMAGMLTARLRVLPPVAWEAVFAAAAAWFTTQLIRSRRGTPTNPWRCLHPAPHLVECAAMLYMFLALPTSKSTHASAMTMPATTSRYSVLALLLALFMFGYVVRVGDRLTTVAPALATPSDPSSTSQVHPRLAPRCAALCKIAMGLTMGYMLILML